MKLAFLYYYIKILWKVGHPLILYLQFSGLDIPDDVSHQTAVVGSSKVLHCGSTVSEVKWIKHNTTQYNPLEDGEILLENIGLVGYFLKSWLKIKHT